jgi:putative oxidoreductase
MLIKFLATDSSRTALFQRVALGLVMLPHGLQKTIGWFGGSGLTDTMALFTSALGLPATIAGLVIAAESAGAVALLAGLATRLSALGIAAVMSGAVLFAHLPNGFFMNWSGQQGGEGFEYHLLALALALPLVVNGGGAASVDGWLARVFGAQQVQAGGAATRTETRRPASVPRAEGSAARQREIA